jgi:hypothetical protein
MNHTYSEKIIYINDKCVGKYPCYHFVTLEKDNEQYKVLMSSIQIYNLCHNIHVKPTYHIRNNFIISNIINNKKIEICNII